MATRGDTIQIRLGIHSITTATTVKATIIMGVATLIADAQLIEINKYGYSEYRV